MNEYEEQAKKFLADTESTLDIKFNRFASMPWDTDGAKRNIFDITLTKAGKSYSFEFGSSLFDSCKETAKIYSDGKVKIFTGKGWQGEKSSRTGFIFEIEASYTDLLAIEKGEMQPSDLYKDERLQAECDKRLAEYSEEEHNKQKKGLQRAIHRDSNIRRFQNTFGFLKAKQAVDSNIQKEIEKAKKETLLINQADEIVQPSEYDILASLQVSYCEDLEEFISEFGYSMCTKEERELTQSTYEAVRGQSDALTSMYNEEELEELHEIQ